MISFRSLIMQQYFVEKTRQRINLMVSFNKGRTEVKGVLLTDDFHVNITGYNFME